MGNALSQLKFADKKWWVLCVVKTSALPNYMYTTSGSEQVNVCRLYYANINLNSIDSLKAQNSTKYTKYRKILMWEKLIISKNINMG